MIGQKIAPILIEIENTLWEFEAHKAQLPDYPDSALPAAAKIFMSVMMEQIWHLMEKENVDQKDRENMVERAGEELRSYIKKYTNLDTRDFYK